VRRYNQRAYGFGISAALAAIGIGLYFVNHPLPSWQTLKWPVGVAVVVTVLFLFLIVRWYRRTLTMTGIGSQPNVGKSGRRTSSHDFYGFFMKLLKVAVAVMALLALGVFFDREQAAYRSNRNNSAPVQTIQVPPPQQTEPARVVSAAETNPTGAPSQSGVNVPRESSFTMLDNDTMRIKFAGSEPEGMKTLTLSLGQAARITYKGGVIYPDLNVSDEHHPIQGVPSTELNRPPDIAARFRYQSPYNAYAVLILLGDQTYAFPDNRVVEIRNQTNQEQTIVVYFNDAQPFYGDNGGNAIFEVHRYN
jgi:hypothetical protein